MFSTVYFGRHPLSLRLEYAKAERAVVRTKTPLDIYAGREFVCETLVEISVAREHLQ